MVKRMAPLLPVAAFPFTVWLAAGINVETEAQSVFPVLAIVLFWLLGLAGAVIVLWQSLRGGWEGRRLALASMAVKLLHVQNYIVLFLMAVAAFMLPVLAVVVWAFDVMTMFLSGLVGLAAVLRCRVEGRLSARATVVNGILQFVFCADVFSAVWVYRESRGTP